MSGRSLAVGAVVALTLFDIATGHAAEPAGFAGASAPDSWTGFYVGVAAGGSGARGDVSLPAFASSNTKSSTGGAFGIYAGYNLLISPVWLVGIEGSVTYGDQNRQASSMTIQSFDGFSLTSSSSTRVSNKWQETIRGRVGFLLMPNMLIYATGGLAILDEKVSIQNTMNRVNGLQAQMNPINDYASFSATRFGWALGAGAEYRFSGQWSARLDYLFADYGSKTYALGDLAARVKTQTQALTLSASYRF